MPQVPLLDIESAYAILEELFTIKMLPRTLRCLWPVPDRVALLLVIYQDDESRFGGSRL